MDTIMPVYLFEFAEIRSNAHLSGRVHSAEANPVGAVDVGLVPAIFKR